MYVSAQIVSTIVPNKICKTFPPPRTYVFPAHHGQPHRLLSWYTKSKMVKLHPRFEFGRKVLHILLGTIVLTICALTYIHIGLGALLGYFFAYLFGFTLVEIDRIKQQHYIPFTKHLTRDWESRKLCSGWYSFLAATICFSVFPFPLAFAAYAINIYSDPFSLYIGSLFKSRTKRMQK